MNDNIWKDRIRKERLSASVWKQHHGWINEALRRKGCGSSSKTKFENITEDNAMPCTSLNLRAPTKRRICRVCQATDCKFDPAQYVCSPYAKQCQFVN